MNKLLLIDGYAMIYRAYYAFVKNPRITSKGMNTSAIFGFLITLDELIRKVNPTHIAVGLDPQGGTFRHEAYKQYKAQRAATPEDIRTSIPYIKSILKAMRIKQLEVSGFEADDVIGTIAHKAEAVGFDVLMATPDKDYGQLVTDTVHIYRPRHAGGFEELGPAEVCAKYNLANPIQIIDLLGLMGDASDNIPGCQGVGEKRAVELLKQFGSIDNLLANADQVKGKLGENIQAQAETIRFSRFLATIRLDVPIDFNPADYVRQEADYEALRPIYQELEFKTLLSRLPAPQTPIVLHDGNNSSAGQADLMLDLFADFTEMHTTEIRKDNTLPTHPLIALHADNDYIYWCENDTEVHQIERAKWQWMSNLREIITYDAKALYAMCSIPYDTLFDTSIAHYLLQPESHHEIDDLAEIYFHETTNGNIANRLTVAFRLKPILEAELRQAGNLYNVFRKLEMPLVPILVNMERNGVRFDWNILEQAHNDWTQELLAREQHIYELGGKAFNLNSPKQVGELLFEHLLLDPKAKKTRGGNYVTSEEVLNALKHTHPIVSEILEYRALKKLLSTYIDALPLLKDPLTGKVHTTYNQTVTATGRLSSSNPNLQNLPIRQERGRIIREAVIPEDNCVFMAADYSQIELRLMAHLSQDEHLIYAFQHGQDIHTATAAKIFNVPLEEVSKEQRRKAKTANFGIIYGVSAFGLAEQLSISRSEAKKLIDDYFRTFPRVVQCINQLKTDAIRKGYCETLFGRRRYLPDIKSRNAVVRAYAERNAVNAPIQGTAADIIKQAMVHIWQRLHEEDLKTTMILQVHDELCFSVPMDEVERVKSLVINEMESAVTLSVPLEVSCEIGNNWLTAH